MGEDRRRLDPRQAGVRGPSEDACPLAAAPDTTTKEVGELDHEHEEGADGKNGRCDQERAEDYHRHNADDKVYL
eukprot:scaffold96342_cov73-Phaeocystis_antarctica.AAC.2